MPSLGEQFRAAREARGTTLSEAAERIHIRSIYLQAIEEEDWPAIGAAVYVRGFLRTYARFLGLDPESAVARFNDLTGIHAPPAPASVMPSALPARRGPSVWVWLAGLVAVALLVIVAFSFWQLEGSRGVQGEAAPAAAGPTSVPAVASPAQPSTPISSAQPTPPLAEPSPMPSSAPASQATAPAPPLAGVETLGLTFTAPAWVRIVVDGKVVTEGTFTAGTVRTYEGHAIHVRLGNAGGVEIKENGRDLGTLGGSGEVVDRTFTARNAN